ncbi:MAG: ferrous iron transport protein A [Leptolyngbyaceae cyanobacterium CRU_2_3]|nr:ferrous iron transport protein A [Leptolyngbyaceae cyanobacterium CRU_2_3]
MTANYDSQNLQGRSLSTQNLEIVATPLTPLNSLEAPSQNQSGHPKAFPLAMGKVGERLAISQLNGSEGTVRRLIGLGLLPGIELQIVSHQNSGLVVAIADNRIGLGVGMAQKILCITVV